MMAIASPNAIVHSIAYTLEHDVLPAAPVGWPASYLRSAVMLLTYLEDRLTLGPALLRDDDLDLRSVLTSGAQAFEASGGAPALVEQLHQVMAEPDNLHEEHEARRAALCDLIKAVYQQPALLQPEALQNVRDVIAHYRERSLAREDSLWHRAEKLPLM